MNQSRREFLKAGVKTILAAGFSLSALEVLRPEVLAALKKMKGYGGPLLWIQQNV